MTTQTLQPVTHLSTRTLAMAGAGALLTVAAGFGIYALVDDAPAISDTPGSVGSGYDGTDREVRDLMHRR